jgi:hypothetical protein
VPALGGGFFRLFPYSLTRQLLAYANRANRSPAVIYIHPWEIDPGQPANRRLLSAFAFVINSISVGPKRDRRLLSDFAAGHMDQIFLNPASPRLR